MAYDPLTPARFKELKPEFAEVSDATVQLYIDLASRFVDETWTAGDYEAAWTAMTCHLMTLAGLGTSTESEVAAASGSSRLTRLKSGQLDLTFAESETTDDDFKDWLNQTGCGQFYAVLLQLNKRGPRLLTGWGAGCQSGYAKDVPNCQSAPWFRGAGSDKGFK